ncbi:hypothetical protein L1049_025524 [Liquidambar formosana]|uniref:Uncharacterized protein n=1 Tax=Liquidambar formosana TaxID=63359 RepID=A0AAP0NCZ4_LIQFO
MGDYVIEGNYHGLYRDYDLDDYLGDAFLSLESFGPGRNSIHSLWSSQQAYHSLDEDDDVGMYRSSAAGTGHRRLYFGRSRRRRHGDANDGR